VKKKLPAALADIAHHEAGHAVASFALRLRVLRVHIIPDQERGLLGCCEQPLPPKWFQPEWDNSPRVRDCLERAVITHLAGPAAEAKYTGQPNPPGCEADLQWAINLVDKLCSGPEQSEAYVKYLNVTAHVLVAVGPNWRAIRHVARELLKHQQLTGRQARAAYLAGQEAWYASVCSRKQRAAS
jgi:hypothetical protein